MIEKLKNMNLIKARMILNIINLLYIKIIINCKPNVLKN